MPTQFEKRVLILIPAGLQAAFNNYWANQIDDGGSGDQTFTAGLSATGNAPATHFWASTALREQELKRLLIELCRRANITQPTNWDSLTRPQKAAWLVSNLPTIRQNLGVRVVVDDQEGSWSNPLAALAAHGLKVVEAGTS